MPTDMDTQISYVQAINHALSQAMIADPNVIVIGEGVPDPKAIFGTTAGLRETFGPNRVFDMPLAENGMTGVCIGAAITGMRPVMVHQRIDFALLAMDQLVNNAAKWHYMFNGQSTVPLVVRTIIGRGWGQGPQHSQGLQSMFAHVPGLKVVMPASPADAKGLMMAAIKDNNPVLYIEHRWLHNLIDDVPETSFETPIGQARVTHEGTKLTVAGLSYPIVEALHVARELAAIGIDIEVVDMRSARPLDIDTLATSVRKTGRLLVVDSAWPVCGIASELISQISKREFGSLRRAPASITYPDMPSPTSPHMSNGYFPTEISIIDAIAGMLDVPLTDKQLSGPRAKLQPNRPLDAPRSDFTGPF